MKKVLFMGSSDFALPSLCCLINNGLEVVLVVTQPDKPFGKKKELKSTPVKIFSKSKNIEVFTPNSLKEPKVYEKLYNLNPDFTIVASYGKILPSNILKISKVNLNVHGSLLPRWRGASPVQFSIINGDKKTGVTIIEMNAGLDTGDILDKIETDINLDETTDELMKRLSILGAESLLNVVDKIINKKNIQKIKQDERFATYAPIIKKENALINWSKSAFEIKNLIRGMIPWPIAYTFINNKKLEIYSSKLVGNLTPSNPGKILSRVPFIVSCGFNSCLEILEVKLESKKRMRSKDFFNGYKFNESYFKDNK